MIDQTRAAAFYAEKYDEVVRYPFVAERQTRIQDHLTDRDRRCRYCRRGLPDVTFRSAAHAVPEFLGNKSIVSMNECDKCNKHLATEYEDHLAKWTHYLRAMLQVPGKAKPQGPTFRSFASDGVSRVESQAGRVRIQLSNYSLEDKLTKLEGTIGSSIPLSATSQLHVPLRAGLTLVRIACSICPSSQLEQCTPAIDALVGRVEFTTSKFPILFAFTPGPNVGFAGEAILLTRKTADPIPYLWCIVRFATVQFQAFVPGCPADQNWFLADQENAIHCPYYPSRFPRDWPFGQTRYSLLDWSGTKPVEASATLALMSTSEVRRIHAPDTTNGTDA